MNTELVVVNRKGAGRRRGGLVGIITVAALIALLVLPPLPAIQFVPTVERAWADPGDNVSPGDGDPPVDEVAPEPGALGSASEPPAEQASDQATAELPSVGILPAVADMASEDLLSLLMGFVAGREETFGIAVKNLVTGETALVNADLQFEAASLYKLALMYELVRELQAGELSLDEELVATEDLFAAYEDWEPSLALDEMITIGDAAYRMITISDNTCAHLLLQRVPGWRVNLALQESGLTQTEVLDGQRTSAQDMLRILELIATGQAPDAEGSNLILRLLLEQAINDRIPPLLPEGTPVAHKTGNWEDAVNDVGIVYSPRDPFIIVVLCQGVYDVEMVDWSIAELSRAVYDYFASR